MRREENQADAFLVCFFKTVSNDTGHEKEIEQGRVRVKAGDSGHAMESAKASFCRQQEILDWTLRADRLQVEPVGPGDGGLSEAQVNSRQGKEAV